MTPAKFQFSSDILRRLGEELNQSIDQGILELVKNAYDADATNCTVELFDIETPGGQIVVHDSGNGMTAAEILSGWLVLGRSGKSTSSATRLGRIPAGNKGLGRLSALRLGTRVMLSTRPRSEIDVENNLLIDWDEFDEATLVNEVDLSIEQSHRGKGEKTGTSIYIENLREGVSRSNVKRLARELILLADPFESDPAAFRPQLIAPEFADLEALVKARYFDDAEFHLQAELDENGRALAKVVDWKGEVLYVADHEIIASKRSGALYKCPRAKFEMWVFILDGTTFSTRKSTINEVSTWLKAFGGIHIYHNALRVTPYGNEGNDWLDINLRRAQSPQNRPSTNTSIGKVEIVDQSGALAQKTDRSGFIEGAGFTQLRNFCHDALEWLASRRQEEADKRRAHGRATATKKASRAKLDVETAISNLPEASQLDIEKVFASYESSRDREVLQLHKEVQLYRTLSTAGITAATFAHESTGSPVKVIQQSINAIHRRAKVDLGDRYESRLGKPVDGIKRAVKSLSVLGAATLKLVDHEKRRKAKVNLHKVVREVLSTFEPFMSGRDVEVTTSFCKASPFIHGSEAAIESIITNLLNNVLTAFEDFSVSTRKIDLSTSVDNDNWKLKVSDNGPGISGIHIRDIWLPGRTTRKNGTGLGLTIVRDAAQDLGGSVSVIEKGKLGGAEFTVTLPIISG